MLLALVAFLAAAALTLVGLHRWGPRRDPLLFQPGEGPDAARAFLADWRASRMATWAIDASFERRTAAGGRLSATLHRAQDPPNRMSSGVGSVDGIVGGHHLDCSTDGNGHTHCTAGAPALPYEVEVDREIATLRTYVLAAPPLYAVRREGSSCFRLRLVIAHYASPPYGQLAVFCWDQATHAPRRAEIHRAEGADVTVTYAIRRHPTAGDLAPPGP